MNESPANVYIDNFQISTVSGGLLEENHYYPFGMLNEGLSHTGTNDPINNYKYNGKELQKELFLEWLDYGARFYDPVIGRWHSVDPLAEKYFDLSLYNYVGNNPILRIDMFGMDWFTDKDGSYQYDPDLNQKNSKTRLTDGQKYVGASYEVKNEDGDVTTNYRKDGSIVYNNQTYAYKRMSNQGNKAHREQFAVITEESVIVLPEYKNVKDQSYYDLYGYSFDDNGRFVDKESGKTIEIVATAHTHPNGSWPSTYEVYDHGDLGTAAFQTPHKMMIVFGLGDGTTTGLIGYYEKNVVHGTVETTHRSLRQILTGDDLRARLKYMNKVINSKK